MRTRFKLQLRQCDLLEPQIPERRPIRVAWTGLLSGHSGQTRIGAETRVQGLGFGLWQQSIVRGFGKNGRRSIEYGYFG